MERDANLRLLGTRIRQRRREMGWSQEHLALLAEIDRSYIGGVERGERNVTFTVLCKISLALGLDVGSLASSIPEPR